MSHLVLMDFFESDNDGLYTLMMLAALGFAVVLIGTVIRQSRASDRARLERATLVEQQTAEIPSEPEA